MTPSKSASSPLDRAFFALVTRGWDASRIKNYEESLRRRDGAMSGEAERTFASIDAKATGLLTHTSMMIAGLGLIAPLVADSFQAFEVNDAGERIRELIHRELIIRSELYRLCIRSAIVFTIVVVAVLPILFFYSPGKPA